MSGLQGVPSNWLDNKGIAEVVIHQCIHDKEDESNPLYTVFVITSTEFFMSTGNGDKTAVYSTRNHDKALEYAKQFNLPIVYDGPCSETQAYYKRKESGIDDAPDNLLAFLSAIEDMLGINDNDQTIVNPFDNEEENFKPLG